MSGKLGSQITADQLPSHSGQRKLDSERTANFYHDLFVTSQIDDFSEICAPDLPPGKVVSDMGGGCGFFASAVQREFGVRARVVDADPVSVEVASREGNVAVVGDVLAWIPLGDESAACFNLILHHLVGRGESETLRLQMTALDRWTDAGVRLFINEYIYDSFIGEVSGALIFRITASRFLSAVAKAASWALPSLRANTFGVGVRFRAEREWRRLFESRGWRVVGYRRGAEEPISLPRRLLLIKSCRRDSFVLLRSVASKTA